MLKSRRQEFGIVYRATNVVNNKIYIGQTWRSLSERIQKHIHNSGCIYFHSALIKYGSNNFTWEILFKSDDQKLLDLEEDRLIKFYKSNNKKFGYNLRLGGSCGKFSKESKDKMSQSALRYFNSLEARKKHGKIQKLRYSKFEERVKLSRAHGGRSFYGRKDNEIKEFKTQVEAADYIGVLQSTIKSALKGLSKEVKGWLFSYEEIKEYKSLKHIKYKELLIKRTEGVTLVDYSIPGWSYKLAEIWKVQEHCVRSYLKDHFPDIYKKAYRPRPSYKRLSCKGQK